jgi:hypothetical protein
MFCTSRKVIGRLAWADAGIAIAVDATTMTYARQREKVELRTVGVEKGEKAPRTEAQKRTNVVRERRQVDGDAFHDSYAGAAAGVDPQPATE